MSIEQKLKLLGVGALILGSIAALLCIYPTPQLLFIAIPIGFIGMIGSSLYVFLDMKYSFNSKKITPGIIGLLLSSVPVLLVLTFIIISFFRH